MRNIDRIRQMSLDEMAEIISELDESCSTCAYYFRDKDCDELRGCVGGVKAWLMQETKEER